jgi:hypothetical protein
MAHPSNSAESQPVAFTVREAARRTGLPPQRVRYYAGQWARAGYGGFIRPEIAAGGGQGTAMVLGRKNLTQLRVVCLLREAGLSEKETRHLFEAKGLPGADWWDPEHSLGSDALLLVRGAPEWPAVERWLLCTPDLRIKPPTSWAAAVVQAAGPECELVHARFQSGWQPRLPNDRRDCWVFEGAHEAWVVNIGQIRHAVMKAPQA